MSKKSHAKHEHNAHHESDHITTADEMHQDFSKNHRTLIIVLVIIMIVVLPLLFAAATLLRMTPW